MKHVCWPHTYRINFTHVLLFFSLLTLVLPMKHVCWPHTYRINFTHVLLFCSLLKTCASNETHVLGSHLQNQLYTCAIVFLSFDTHSSNETCVVGSHLQNQLCTRAIVFLSFDTRASNETCVVASHLQNQLCTYMLLVDEMWWEPGICGQLIPCNLVNLLFDFKDHFAHKM